MNVILSPKYPFNNDYPKVLLHVSGLNQVFTIIGKLGIFIADLESASFRAVERKCAIGLGASIGKI